MLRFTVSGGTRKTEKFLQRMAKGDLYSNLDQFGRRGVAALRAATPRDSGATADAWDYEIIHNEGKITIWWKNTNTAGGYYNVAIGLQYGHGTGTGGYIAGTDFINPALKPIFDDIARGVWKVVTSS